jgi:hypothetical protein
MGGQVLYDQNYTALLQDLLVGDGLSDIRVINAGIGGCRTYCQAGVLRENVGWMQPDLVVVSVFVGNNIAENVLAVRGGYRDAPEHPKGVTWGPAAAELLDQSGSWFPRNGLLAADVPPRWDPSQPLPRHVGNSPPGTPPYMPPSAGEASVGSPVAAARAIAHAVWDGARTHSLLLGHLFGQPVDPSVTTAPGASPPSKELKRLNVSSFEWTILRDPPRTYWLDVAWPLFGSYLAGVRATAAGSEPRQLSWRFPRWRSSTTRCGRAQWQTSGSPRMKSIGIVHSRSSRPRRNDLACRCWTCCRSSATGPIALTCTFARTLTSRRWGTVWPPNNLPSS